MSKYTKKSCPGCSAVVELAPGTVCHSCSTAIREYPEAKARLKSSDSASLKEFLMGERAGIPSVLHRYNSAKNFATDMSTLLRCVGNGTRNTEPQPFHNHRKMHYSQFGILEVEHRDTESQDWRLFLPQDIEQHLAALYQSLREVVGEAEKKGQSKGQNLLFQLNAGTLSLTDFEQEHEKCN